MRHIEKRFRALLLLSCGALAAAAPSSADWIKTREGALVETRGGFKVKGQIVVFTAANGTLSSLRLSEVDLDGSAVATFEAREKAKEKATAPLPEAERAPVLVLTNANIPRAHSAIEKAEGEGEGEGDEAGPAEAAGRVEQVRVISWQPVENGESGGLELTGALQNQGDKIASNLRLVVRLYDASGEYLGASNAFLEGLSLAPTSSVKFRALFPNVTETSVTPEFEVKSSAIQLEAVLTDTKENNEDNGS